MSIMHAPRTDTAFLELALQEVFSAESQCGTKTAWGSRSVAEAAITILSWRAPITDDPFAGLTSDFVDVIPEPGASASGLDWRTSPPQITLEPYPCPHCSTGSAVAWHIGRVVGGAPYDPDDW